MTGSGEAHMCYFYKRTSDPATVISTQESHVLINLVGRPEFHEEDTEVFCDPIFQDAGRMILI